MAVLFCAGCGREEIRSYQIPKEPQRAARAGRAPGPVHLHSEAPEHWNEIPAASPRLARFEIKKNGLPPADVSVIELQGREGLELDLANMWREERALPGLGPAEFATLPKVQVGTTNQATLLELGASNETEGPGATNAILSALWSEAGSTLAVKLSGVSSLIHPEKPAFLNFLKTISIHAAEEDAAPASASPAIGKAAKPKVLPSGPRWELPSGWKETQPGPMLAASFVIEHPEGKAIATVSMLAGEGGGALGNVNRWRNQIGLKPISKSELTSALTSLDLKVGQAMLVEVINEAQGQRIVAAILPYDGNTWFYKLTGSAAVVEKEKPRFVQFLKTLDHAR